MMSNRCGRRVSLLAGILVCIFLAGCGGITMKNYPTAEEQYRGAMEEYQNKSYLKAIDGFQKVVFNFSGATMVDSAQYYLAMAYYQQKDYYLAAAEFERLVNNYPGSQFVDDCQYMAGLCYFKSSPKNSGLDQDELKRSLELLQDFVTDYPGSELADDARATYDAGMERLAKKRFKNGKMYYRLGYYRSSEIYFQAVIDEHTSSEWAAEALFYLGEIEYKRENYQEAQTTFNNFLVVYPDNELAQKARKKLADIEEKFAESESSK